MIKLELGFYCCWYGICWRVFVIFGWELVGIDFLGFFMVLDVLFVFIIILAFGFVGLGEFLNLKFFSYFFISCCYICWGVVFYYFLVFIRIFFSLGSWVLGLLFVRIFVFLLMRYFFGLGIILGFGNVVLKKSNRDIFVF